jgi:hypothetical protein
MSPEAKYRASLVCQCLDVHNRLLGRPTFEIALQMFVPPVLIQSSVKVCTIAKNGLDVV